MLAFAILFYRAIVVHGNAILLKSEMVKRDKGPAISEVSDTSTLTINFQDGRSETLEHSDALFGMNSYQAGITGVLYYFSDPFKGCSPLTDPNIQRKILLVDRSAAGDSVNATCSFTRKVFNAEAAGALGVLVADSVGVCGDKACPWGGPDCGQCPSYQTASCQCSLPMMADSGGGAVTIPSMLVSKYDGIALKTLAINPATAPKATLRWDIPAADGSVLMELWQDSIDEAAATFRNVWQLYVPYLKQTVRFSPHFYVIDGDDAGCTDGQSFCSTQCVNGGYYCAVDPDGDPDKGVSGGDVVLENLRSMCVYLEANKTFSVDFSAAWWKYAALYQVQCSDPAKWGASCSVAQQRAAGFSDAALSSIARCVSDSNATAEETWRSRPSCQSSPYARPLSQCNWTNSLLQADMLQIYEMNIRYLPSVRVEGLVLSGSMSPPGVLAAVCAAFGTGASLPGSRIPSVCACAGPAGSDVGACLASLNPPAQTTSSPTPGWAKAVIVLAVFALVGVIGVVWYVRRTRLEMEEDISNVYSTLAAGEEEKGVVVREDDLAVGGGLQQASGGGFLDPRTGKRLRIPAGQWAATGGVRGGGASRVGGGAAGGMTIPSWLASILTPPSLHTSHIPLSTSGDAEDATALPPTTQQSLN